MSLGRNSCENVANELVLISSLQHVLLGLFVKGKQEVVQVLSVVYCFQNLFKRICYSLVWFPSNFFSRRFVKFQVVQPYSSTDTATASRFIFSERSDFYIVNNLSIAAMLYLSRFLSVMAFQPSCVIYSQKPS